MLKLPDWEDALFPEIPGIGIQMGVQRSTPRSSRSLDWICWHRGKPISRLLP